MPLGWIAAATAVAGLAGASASKSAGKAQADATRQAAELQNEQYYQTREDQAPWRAAGETALNKLVPLATEYTPFGMDQFKADPGYAFRLSEGMKALDRQAAARGGLISGSALKAAQRFGQEMGSQEYTNAFNRYQTERQARLNPLQSLAGLGQTAVNQLGQAGQTAATNIGNLMTSGAAARASGYVGSTNALNQAVGSIGNMYMQQQMLNKFPTQTTTSTTSGSAAYNPNWYAGTGSIAD